MIGWKGRTFRKLAYILPIKTAYKIQYKRWYGKRPNLDNPGRFTEKLMWITRYNELYNKELIQEIYDKYTVRDYIKRKGMANILINQYGHFNDIAEIDFDSFPNDYILKSTQSSGQNIIVTQDMTIDREALKQEMDTWLNRNKQSDRFQGYYYTKNDSIVCEELLKDEEGKIPIDIRICCCNGRAKWIYCDIDAIDEDMKHKKAYHREYFDLDWNFLPIDNVNRTRKDKRQALSKKPENLEEIIEIAELLSEDFIFVRVDLYNINNKIYFGELTPIPGMVGGFEPDKWDYTFGDMITLPDAKIW